MSDALLGVPLAIGAAAAFETSYVLQAHQARRVERAAVPGVRFLGRLLARRWWLVGTALAGVAFGLELVALRFVGLTVVQPLLALGLLALLALSVLVLGERVGRGEVIAAAAIGAGAVLVVAGAPPQEAPVRSLPLQLAVCGALAAVLLVPTRLGARDGSRRWTYVAAAAAGDVLVALATNEVARAGVERPLVTVAWLAVVAVAGLMAMTSEAAALQRLPASRVGPIVSGAQVVGPVVLTAVTLRVGWQQATGHGWLLAGGVALVAAGAIRLGAVRAARDMPSGPGGGP